MMNLNPPIIKYNNSGLTTREKNRLKQPVADNATLEMMLSRQSVSELNDVRKIWDADLPSKMRKQALIDALAEIIRNELENFAPSTFLPVYLLLTDGELSTIHPRDIRYSYEFLKNYGLAYPVMDDEEMIQYVIPDDVKAAFSTSSEFETIVRSKYDIVMLTQGLVNLYGAIAYDDLLDWFEEKLNYELAPDMLDYLLEDSNGYFTAIDYEMLDDELHLVHIMNDDFEENHDAAMQLKKRSFEPDDALLAYNMMFSQASSQPAMEWMTLFREHTTLDSYEEMDFTESICYAVADGLDPNALLNDILERCHFSHPQDMDLMTKAFMAYYHTAHQWALGGSSPNELAPAPVSKLRKVGRNDPCPCGSGKKYKKCCLQKDEAANLVRLNR